jgi:hypothetical protein
MRSETKRSALAPATATAVITALTLSCGSATSLDTNDFEVGRRPEFFSAAYLWQAGDANSVVVVDREGHTVQQFTLEPFEHVRSLPLPLEYEEQGVVASHDGSYYITIAADEYAILGQDGRVDRNPVELLGSVTSIAFDPVHHLAVLSDEFQSMALLVLSPDGEVVGSWKAGSLFDEDKYVVAGTMLADGRLILSLGETTIAVIDVQKSVASQKWEYDSFEVPDAKQMSWLAAVPGQESLVMVADGTRVVVLDVDAEKVFDELPLEGAEILGKFRDYVPHVITRDVSGTDVNTVIYVKKSGKLGDTSIKGTTNKQITQTLFDRDRDVLTIVYDPDTNYSWSWDDERYYAPQEVYRFRLADSLAMDRTEVDTDVRSVPTPDWNFLLYPSALGKAERRDYGKEPNTQVLEGYNFDLFRERYSSDD